MAKVLINETSLSGIAEAIRAKNGSSETYKPSEMAAAIEAIEAGGGGGDLPEEAFTIAGDCSYRFAYGGWDWFIENYGDKVTTKDIINAERMFHNIKAKQIPFEVNFETGTQVTCAYLFAYASELVAVPKINNCKATNIAHMFAGCYKLREIPDDIADWFDWSFIDTQTSAYSGNQDGLFMECYSLRKLPMNLLEHGNPTISYTYCVYRGLAENCYALDEIVDLPNPNYSVTWTGNVFASSFSYCSRLKNLTFKTPNGAPYVVNWKSQILDLTYYVGYVRSGTAYLKYLLDYNSGITADKEVTDAATYEALKNDPDWWTRQIAYSRYNHDSAVATINSLPDTSAYLAEKGGTNTIKFKGASGSATDGGAINTLTDAEIAVAAAKGWTVSLS